MKRILQFALIAALAFSGRSVVQASGPAICDPQQSNLCVGLGSVFAFEEVTDKVRWDENKGVAWLEADGQNIATAVGKVGTNAASFVGTAGNYLYIPRAGEMMNGSTISMWLYPTSNAAEQIILSSDEDKKQAPYFEVIPSGAGVKARLVLPYGDGRGTVYVTNSKVLTLSTWYLVTFGYGPNPAPDFSTTSQTGNIAYIQINDLPLQYVALNFFTIGYQNDLVLGQRGTGTGSKPFSGRVDQLTFANRQWELKDVSAFYQSGSGAAYPFTVFSTIDLDTQLTSYWPFEDNIDKVSGNNLVYSGGNQTGAAKIGNGFITGVNGYATQAGVLPFNGDFTIGGWMKWNTAVNQYIFSASTPVLFYIGGSGHSFIYNVNLTTGQCQVAQADMLPFQQWAFVVLQWDNSSKTCSVRVNDTTTYSTVASFTLATGQSGLNWADGGSGYSNFDFDEMFAYTRKISAAEITSLYNGGAGRTYPF